MYNLPHIQCNQPKKINLSLEKCKPYTILMRPNGSVGIIYMHSKYIISIAKFSEILFKYNNYLHCNNQLFAQVHSNKWQKVFPVPKVFFARTSCMARFL